MTKPTHYADIADTTIWRVRFTPPEGMDEDEIREWLIMNWADYEADGIYNKDICGDGDTEITFIARYDNPQE